jgi:hypothetical protein
VSPHDPSPGSLPEHEQRAWDAIVADLSGQIDLGPDFPKEDSLPPALPPLAAAGDHPDPLADPVDWDDEEGPGFEPPEPPPIPRPADVVSRFAWAGALGGPLLVVATNLLGWETWLAGLGVAAAIGGFVVLVGRRPEREDDGSNGAVV